MKPIPDPVEEYIAAATVCRIATARLSGAPHLIPVCHVFDPGANTVYVDLTRLGASARAIRENPNVAVLIDEYHDDWSKLQAVILHCRAEPVQGGELDKAWELFHAKFPQGAAIGWVARLTLALRIQDWIEWGITQPLPYQPE